MQYNHHFTWWFFLAPNLWMGIRWICRWLIYFDGEMERWQSRSKPVISFMTLLIIRLNNKMFRDILHNGIIATWIKLLWNFASAPTFLIIASATG
ncbi:hypothetical protein DHD05_12630 [Arenibacter sp. N53]|nr:hypothetical protein [Arenibacter sp. N53]